MEIITISTELLGNICMYVGGATIVFYGLRELMSKFTKIVKQ